MELIENPLAQVVDANNHTTTKYKARDGRISQSQSHSSIANDRSPSGKPKSYPWFDLCLVFHVCAYVPWKIFDDLVSALLVTKPS